MNQGTEKVIQRKLENMLYLTGVLLLLFLALDILVAAIFLLIGISINQWVLIIAIVLTIVAGRYLCVKKGDFDKKEFIAACSIALIIVLSSCWISGKYYDNSYDGNAYHKLAIGNLKNTWNPIYESANDFFERTNLEMNGSTQATWLDHYAKATWMYGASIYAITDNIETGKSINYIFVFILFFLFNDYLLKKRFKMWQSFLISACCSFNPIVIVQIMTFYVDGTLGLSLFVVILALVTLSDRQYHRSKCLQWLILGTGILICGNIKFTGLIYAGFFCVAFYIGKLIYIYLNQKEKFVKILKHDTLYYFVVLIITVGIVGSNSYMKNLIDHRNPFYPLMGNEKVDIISGFQPDEFQTMNPYKKFVLTLFSYTENVSKEPISLKVPFTTKPSEFEMFTPDIRRGGWGPYFSGIFLISIVICTIELIILWKKNKGWFVRGIQILIPSLMIIGLADGSWWARYSPYVYLLPIAAMIILFDYANKHHIIAGNIISLIFSVLLINNTCCLDYALTYQIWLNEEAKPAILSMKNAKNVKCQLTDGNYSGIVYNLIDEDIPYHFVEGEYENKIILFKLSYAIEEDR